MLYEPIGQFDIFNHTHPNQKKIQTTIKQIQKHFFARWLVIPNQKYNLIAEEAEKVVANHIGNDRLIGNKHPLPPNSLNSQTLPQIQPLINEFTLNQTFR